MPEFYTDESGKDWSLNDLVAENKRLDGVIQELVGKDLKLKVERGQLVEALRRLHDAAIVRKNIERGGGHMDIDWPAAILNTTTPALKAAGEEG